MNSKRTTDDLILELASRPVPSPVSTVGMLGGILLALVFPLALFWSIFGLRAHLGDAIALLPVQAKILLPLALSILAFGLAINSARPGASIILWPLALPVLLGAVMVTARIVGGSSALLMAEFVGNSAAACFAAIALMSVPPLMVVLILLRRAAPTRPRLTGALVGMAAGAGIASGYALYCTEDSPLFFMVWYGLAICASTVCGAVLGQWFLRW